MPGKTFKVSEHFLLLNFSVKNIYCLNDIETFPVFIKPMPYLKGRNLCEKKLVRKKKVQNLFMQIYS